MKAAAFEYHAPRTLAEATELLARYVSADVRVLAGGQSLLPAMAFRLAAPAHLVDINNIGELCNLSVEQGHLVVQACVRHRAFEQPQENGPLGRLLARVVREIAHYPIRTRGTMCGSLANADPSSEWCLVAATLGAEFTALSSRGQRVIRATEWFQGLMTTALEPDELLLQVRFPLLREGTLFGFQEFSRRAGDFALAMALVTFRVESGVIADPHVGLGGVEATPRRLAVVEKALVGRRPTGQVYAEAAASAASALDPLNDVRYDAEYRRDLARTMIRRALQEASPAT
ncbi:MAG: FAD binding domain-containing protein [Casimicrobiaceae bacterium]